MGKPKTSYCPSLDEVKIDPTLINRSVSDVITKLRTSYASRVTRDIKYRLRQLSNLQRMLQQHETLLVEALKRDLNKPSHETQICELALVHNDIAMFKHKLRQWAGRENVFRGVAFLFDTAFVQPEPYGVALIISAWNYPIYLSLSPLVGAIAAGNCVILKPSEVSPNIAKVFQDLLPRYLDPNCYEVVQGGAEETQELLRERFDTVFYTGSPQVGRLVYQAAAVHLTPVTLELGGKSPVYFADDAARNLDVLAKRYLFGKMMNLGQTCIAPDYIMCSEHMQKLLIEKLPALIKKEFGDNPRQSHMLCRIVNERHTNRLKSLIDASRDKIVFGGEVNVEEKWVAPTIFANASPSDLVMQQEIFGPLIPIMVVENEDEAIEYINRNEKPLALYIFTDNQKIKNKFIDCTSSGSVVINETVLFMSLETLPFGGVGNSGMGSYHGRKSFEAFSHQKPVLDHSKNLFVRTLEGALKEGERTKTKLFMLNELIKYRPISLPSLCGLITFVFGFSAGLIAYLTKDHLLK